MTIAERLATVLMLVPGALWAGVIFFNAVERVVLWARMPVAQYALDFRRSIYRADPLQPVLGGLSLVGTVWFALLTGGTALSLAWSAVGCFAVVMILSLSVNEPINSKFRRRAEGEIPPDVERLRRLWRRVHYIRTVPALAALVCLVLAPTFV